jgi:ribonuclease P protein component
MLPRENRLTKRTDFANVYRIGRFSSEGPLSAKSAPNKSEISRIGFSIEKKFFKKAVERNRMKRVLREAFRENLKELKTGLDIVIFYKKSEKNPDYQEISELVKKIIKKINTK